MTDGAGRTGSGRGPDVIVNAVTEEVFTVGSVAGNDWDTFGRVGSVHFNAQGNLHIFDGQADHIVVVGMFTRRAAGKEPRVCGKAGHRVERDRDRLRADHAPWVDAARPTESKTVD